jgi:hypothetical protein
LRTHHVPTSKHRMAARWADCVQGRVRLTMRFLLSMCVLTGLTFGQTYEVKDRHGIPVVKVFNVKLFRHSDYLKEDFPAFEAAITNVSGQDLHPVPLNVTIHLKNGTTTDFLLKRCHV